VDENGYFYIDWCLPPNDPRLTQEAIQSLLAQSQTRLMGGTNADCNAWRGKLVVVGSGAVVGNDLTDRGATPLLQHTLLVSKHWNVANSLLTGRFVRRAPLNAELALIALLGIVAAVLTWEFPALLAFGLVMLLAASYILIGVASYVQTRLWLPLVPVLGSLLTTHVCLVTWRVVFEQAARRRVKSILSTIVSPKVANVLLQAEKLSLEGARRQITVFFADVRGFTELTDTRQQQAEDFVQKNQLTGPAAEACFDEQARETLETVNLYLGVIADTVLKHDGTLDKFIGDCVMAFWGAPNPDSKHALACVQAAIDAQRAVYQLNQNRSEENRRRELENLARVSAGLPPKPLLPILLLGSGINTGMATVGLMGSEVKGIVRQGNYTVFGREVNLASRLESASGRGRIFIGQITYEHLLRDAPALASTCVELPPRDLKGFRAAVKAYEVPWRSPDTLPLEEESLTGPAALADAANVTGFVQRSG
jgi:adenylate cyclase